MTLKKLYKIIQDRKEKMPKNSYIASLFKEGKDRIIQKVGEEATEVIIAAKNESRERTIAEIADLWLHLLILLSVSDISIFEIEEELERRHQEEAKNDSTEDYKT